MNTDKLRFIGERPSLSDIDGMTQARYRFAVKYTRAKKILEIGCAFGYGAYFMAQNGSKEVVAIDSDKASIEYANRRFFHKKITYLDTRLEDYKSKRKFDMVVALELIEHLKDPEKLLLAARSVLKKGGVAIISTPNRLLSLYDGDKPSNPFHEREYTPKELKNLLKKYFRSLSIYGIFSKAEKDKEEKEVQKGIRWRLSSWMVRKRWIRRIVNYIPEKPKRIFTGETNLKFSPDDFRFSVRDVENAQYMIAVCRL